MKTKSCRGSFGLLPHSPDAFKKATVPLHPGGRQLAFFRFNQAKDDSWRYTPKTNMEPEKDGFQKESPFPGVHFQVSC